jgi:hypothetical protein
MESHRALAVVARRGAVRIFSFPKHRGPKANGDRMNEVPDPELTINRDAKL